ncbi:TPA: hypothetical protein ACH3X2_008993 [Trebouxia sp. C0005]
MDVSPNRHAAAECYHWAMIKQPDPTKRNEVFYFHLLGWRQIQPETADELKAELHVQPSSFVVYFLLLDEYTHTTYGKSDGPKTREMHPVTPAQICTVLWSVELCRPTEICGALHQADLQLCRSAEISSLRICTFADTCRFVHPEIYTAAERTKPTPLINRRPSKQEQDTAVCHAIQQEQQLWPNKAHNAGSLDFPHQFCLSGELLRILHIQCKCVLL